MTYEWRRTVELTSEWTKRKRMEMRITPQTKTPNLKILRIRDSKSLPDK